MAKLSIKAGATSVSVGLFIQDSSSTTGAGLTGVLFNSSGITCYAVVPGSSAAAITLATLAAANSAWSSGGFKEVDSTNMPGVYRFDIPNTNISTGRSVVIVFKGVTNMAPLPLEIELTGWDNQDAVHGGLSSLPNTAVTTNASLLTSGTGTAQLSVSSGQVILQAGTGTGQLDFATGVVKANLVQANGSNITAAGGRPEVNTTHWAGTINSTPATAGIPDINVKNINNVSASAVTAVKAIQGLTTLDTIVTVSGNVNGSVASVTGAVGSVTGAVGSVTGAVGSVTGNIGGNLGGTLTTTERNAIADALLNRDMSTGTDSGSTTVRTVRQALRWLRNKWTISGGTLTVYKEDDATSSWDGAVTTTAGNPTSAVDPSGP